MNYYLSIPNLLSFSRILLTLLMNYYLYKNDITKVIICVILASVSDLLDGFLARKLNLTSQFGAQIDTLADKFFSINMLMIIAYIEKTCLINSISTILILRELIMIILRHTYKTQIPVSKLGKIKTVTLNLAYIAFFINKTIFYILLLLGTILSIISQIHYLYKFLSIK